MIRELRMAFGRVITVRYCSFVGLDSELEVWVEAYGPKALTLAGEVGDGFILQLAVPTSRDG